MSDSATDLRPAPPAPRPATALLVALAALLTLGACAEEPLPQRRLGVDDCLMDVRLDRLREALQRCDRVVAAFPREPQPLNERFLLHSLNGQEALACRDIRQAAVLARRIPSARLDRLLRRDLQLRLASCAEGDGAPPAPHQRSSISRTRPGSP